MSKSKRICPTRLNQGIVLMAPRKRVSIPIEELVCDKQRDRIFAFRMASLKIGIEEMAHLNPISVDESNRIIDGVNRAAALADLGHSEIAAFQFQTNGKGSEWRTHLREATVLNDYALLSPLDTCRFLERLLRSPDRVAWNRIIPSRPIYNFVRALDEVTEHDEADKRIVRDRGISYVCFHIARRLGTEILDELARHSVAHALDADDLYKMAVAPKQAYASITDRLSRRKVTKVSSLRKWINDLPIDESHVARLRKEGLPSTPRALGRDPHA